MRLPVEQLVQFPFTPNEPVDSTVEALENADFSSMPEVFRIYVHRENHSLEITRKAKTLRIHIFAELDFGDSADSEAAKSLMRSSLVHLWHWHPEYKPNESESKPSVGMPLIGLNMPADIDLKSIIQKVDCALNEISAHVPRFFTQVAKNCRFRSPGVISYKVPKKVN